MLDEYRTRRDRLYEWLTADPRVKCHKPGGAFYMFVDISEVLTATGLEELRRVRRGAARGREGGRDAGRGIRRAGVRPNLVRDVDGESARGQPALLEFVARRSRIW